MLSTISFSIAGCRHNCALEAADFHVGSAGAGFLLDCALLGHHLLRGLDFWRGADGGCLATLGVSDDFHS
jgi:hypothetical protein